ncbi:MAG: YraN family protein [Deltaproteobacteria bacterium]|nr:YraN family protein [Deltaproteobacteria bacterium]
MTDRRHQLGSDGEEAALEVLARAGYRVLERNYRCRVGEIDVVAEQGETLCFVEVRTRKIGALVDGRTSIDWRKRRKIAAAARSYCQRRRVGERPMRFDVVDVRALSDGAFDAEIVCNAFDAEGGL